MKRLIERFKGREGLTDADQKRTRLAGGPSTTVTSWPGGSTIVIPESASVSRLRPVTGGPGGEMLIVGRSVIGGAVTGVADPVATGKAEDGDVVTGLGDMVAGGDPAGAGLVPQAARPAAKLAAIIIMNRRPRVVRRMPI